MFLSIDKSSKVPVYIQIRDRIVDMVQSGTLQVGDKLPGTRDLAKQLGVSRKTVLQAYLELAANAADDISFRRVVNTPARGIGEATLRIVEDIARATGLPLMESSAHALEQGLVSSRSARPK